MQLRAYEISSLSQLGEEGKGNGKGKKQLVLNVFRKKVGRPWVGKGARDKLRKEKRVERRESCFPLRIFPACNATSHTDATFARYVPERKIFRFERVD